MAIILPAPIVSAIAGSIAGTTFRRHRGRFLATRKSHGPAVRPVPTRPAVAALALCRAHWKSQVPPWFNAWRTVGLEICLPAYTAFIAWNLLRAQNALPITSIPTLPALHALRLAPALTAISTTSATFNFADSPLYTGDNSIIRFSIPIPWAVTNPRTWTRHTWLAAGPYAGSASYTFPTAYPNHVQIRIEIIRTRADKLPSNAVTLLAQIT